MQARKDIENLLELNGSIIEQGNGHWVKIEAWKVEPTPQIPHGIRYALTLHREDGERIMGYDNAHAVKPTGKFKYAGQVIPYDHKHRSISDKGIPYEFKDGFQLLSDFFAEVDKIVKEDEK
jgi:hypothetical protein